MTDKEKLHQILSSLWKNDDSVGKTYYNQALQDVQTAIDLQEEPISKDLEKAAEDYGIRQGAELKPFAIKFFKAGAKCQKEQMLEKAIDAELYSDGMFVPLIGLKDKEKVSDIKFGDKVKVIIIKED